VRCPHAGTPPQVQAFHAQALLGVSSAGSAAVKERQVIATVSKQQALAAEMMSGVQEADGRGVMQDGRPGTADAALRHAFVVSWGLAKDGDE
jgi:hypothetical protein